MQYTTQDIPHGFCHCGCGQKTKIASSTDPRFGWIKGQPRNYIKGHFRKGKLYAPPEDVLFWRNVTPGLPDECWNWQGNISIKGYGDIKSTRRWLAHRLSYHLHFGPIPEGVFVCHRCDNPACVNPSHLFLGTCADNVRDCVDKGRNSRGELRPASKLTADKVREMRHLYGEGVPTTRLAEQFGVVASTVVRIVFRRAWKHIE
jgi:hypothetical protein